MTPKPRARRKPTPKQMADHGALLLADARDTLRWYAFQAKEIARAWARPDGADAALKASKALAADAGTRAERALLERKDDRP